MKKLVVILAAALLMITTLSLGTSSASALSGGEFQAGRIMDDGIFFDGNSLFTSDIQNFLNSKVPTCDTNGTQSHGGTTRASYGASRGYPPPYTCLKDYSQNTPNKPAETGLCNAYTGGTKTAAQIIYDVGRACGVSQKVLIVLLQKEQSLITDDWPWSVQYRSATGYGCPDTAPCDAEYYGFFNQVYHAARQFKRYGRDASTYRYRAFRDNYIQYNPSASCGGSNVYIQNQATAGLYNYTPYQPNTSALNNLYGSGDSCGAYGNRNFWRQYNDWFGGTFAGQYAASPVAQGFYPTVVQGYSTQTYFTYKNTGNTNWYDEMSAWSNFQKPVRLGTDGPPNRNSPFGNKWRFGPTRAADIFAAVYEADGVTLTNDQHVVRPGQIAKFGFDLDVPANLPPGFYKEGFRPIVEGGSAMPGNGAWLGVTVQPAIYQAQPMGQSGYPSLTQTESTTSYFRFKNTGNVPWHDEFTAWPAGKPPVRLATDDELNRNSVFGKKWRFGATRAAEVFSKVYEANNVTLAANQHIVYPGQIVQFDFLLWTDYKTPAGYYTEAFRPVVEGVGPMNRTGTWIGVRVYPAIPTAEPIGQSFYPTIKQGNSAPAHFMYKNTGNITWYDEFTAWPLGQLPVRLGTENPFNRNSVFGDGWRFGPSRAVEVFAAVYEADGITLTANQHAVRPGQIAKFGFDFEAPLNQATGFYPEAFRPIIEGYTSMSGKGAWIGVTVINK